MKRVSILLLLPLALLLCGCGKTVPEEHSTSLFAMDTYMELKVWTSDDGTALDAAAERVAELEKTFSVNIENSDIYRINSAQGAPVQVCPETETVIRRAKEISEESGGALAISIYPVLQAWGFTTQEMHVPDAGQLEALLPLVDDRKIRLDGDTVTVPAEMQLDLGSVAKGYTGDEIIRIMREAGAESGIISLGGNVQALGAKPDGSPWKVGIVNPFSPDEQLGVVEVKDRAVITSGNYERYFEENGRRYWHILDSADGCPAENGLVSVTVIGDSGLDCDALSTALFVEGTERAAEHWRRRQDFEMLLVTDDGRILLTEGVSATFSNQSGMPVEVIGNE